MCFYFQHNSVSLIAMGWNLVVELCCQRFSLNMTTIRRPAILWMRIGMGYLVENTQTTSCKVNMKRLLACVSNVNIIVSVYSQWDRIWLWSYDV